MRSRFLNTESFRLSAVYAGLLLASVLALGALVYVTMDSAFRDEALQSSDQDLAAIQEGYATEGLSEAIEIVDQRMAAPGESDFFLLERGAGQRLAGNLPAMAPRVGIVEIAYPGGAAGEGHAIFGQGKFLAPELYVFAGRDLHFAHRAKERIVHAFGWILLATILLAALSGYVLSRGFLARLDAIAGTCRAIMAGNLKDRIPIRGTSDELDRLGAVINEMLDRIADLMENIHQVTNDIAHDLRTPLTLLRHRLEQARADAKSQEDFSQAVDDAIAVSDRLLTISSALLRIAQIESGARRAGFEAVDLNALLVELADIYRPVCEDNQHALRTQLNGPATVQGDRELLLQLFANLVENAINHTPSGTSITIALSQHPGRVTASVWDTGPGVPQDRFSDLFKRFYRLEQSRSTPGHGLGLALVAAIAELHGASIEVRGNDPGLRIDIAFTCPRSA